MSCSGQSCLTSQPSPQATFTHLLQLLVRARQPHAAVQLCCEAHSAGVLHHYALPDISQGPPLPGTTFGNVVDLRWGSSQFFLLPLLLSPVRRFMCVFAGPCSGRQAVAEPGAWPPRWQPTRWIGRPTTVHCKHLVGTYVLGAFPRATSIRDTPSDALPMCGTASMQGVWAGGGYDCAADLADSRGPAAAPGTGGH